MNLRVDIVSYNPNFMMAKKSKNISDKELLECVYQGIPKKEIRQRYGLTELYLNTKLLQLNLPTTPVKLRKLYLERQVKEHVQQGENISEICKELNINKSAYYNFIHSLKLKDQEVFSPNTNIGKVILRQNELRELVEQGKTMKEMSNYFNVRLCTIDNALRKLGISTKHMERIYTLKKKHIVEGLQKYNSVKKVAEELNISFGTLRKYMASFNITKQRLGGIGIWR